MHLNLTFKALSETEEQVFIPCGFELKNPIQEKESTAYSAFTFEINTLKIVFRIAKTTPTKIGQFVTLWKRVDKGPIQPYDDTDAIDFVVINTKTTTHFGQFVFPKTVLIEQAIFTSSLKEGKRALRVYPPWDKPTSHQALKTQQWQSLYFLEIPFEKPIDIERIKLLYAIQN
jgi:hypothetical protein